MIGKGIVTQTNKRTGKLIFSLPVRFLFGAGFRTLFIF